MKTKSVTIWSMVVVICLTSSQAIALIEFKDGLIHNIDYFINDDVWVDWDAPGMQTTVNLLGGGYIESGYGLHGYNDSYINISGGYTYTLRVHDNTQVDITDGRAQLFMPTITPKQTSRAG